MLPDITDVKQIELPRYSADNGDLVVVEGAVHIPFGIVRLFTVHAAAGAIRGQHAHRSCAQFLTCPSGCVEVVCFDGLRSANYVLDQPHIGLLIPPGIWSQQSYLKPDTVLSVLCDRHYDEDDYIRELQQFQSYRKQKT
jgi:dTDP-4-dehydrorhamnose 3,5-epimerase-like enzyme